MRNVALVLLLIPTSFLTSAQDTINQKDAQGLKQGKWIFYGKDRPESGIPADGKVEEGTYLDDKKEGTWIRYHDDGKTPKVIGEYVNNRPANRYWKYYKSGQLRERGCFTKNEYCDSLKRFYENGQLEYEARYVDGREFGRVNEYYPSGMLKFTFVNTTTGPTEAFTFTETGVVSSVGRITACNWGDKEYSISCVPVPKDTIKQLNRIDAQGRKQGHWIYYGKDRPESGIPPNGKVEEGYYIDDRKEGEWIRYKEDGVTPKMKGIYENNRPKTNCTFNRDKYPNGQPRRVGTFEKNMYIDSLIGYYENGTREYAAFYDKQGREQGWIYYYHKNGNKEFEYFAKDGLPTGTAIRFYDNGDTNEVITYNSEGQIVSSIHRKPVHEINPFTDPTAPKNYPPVITGTPDTKGVTWKPNGYNKVFNEDGEIWQDGTFKEGSLWDGKVYVYDRDGILLKVKIFKQGLYHSDGQL